MKTGKTFSYRRWAYTLPLFVLCIVGLVVLINCITDPYAILRTDLSLQEQEPNQRFLKIRYLLAHKDRYDSFLFGSSRVLQIDTRKIRNGRYYNMGTSEGIPQEHLQHIEFMLKNGIAIKNVIIALDDFSYRLFPEEHLANLLRQPHYLVSGKRKLDFYAGYFVKLRRFIPTLRDYWKANYTEAGRIAVQKYSWDIYDTGRLICRTCDEEIERDVQKHDRDPKFDRPIIHYTTNNMASALESLRALVRLTRAHDINLTLFINPIHKTSYFDTDLPLFFAFKKELADIAEYYDFSGLNTITINNYYYHESSHYREMVGDMMLARMFGYPRVSVPRDFGVLVTRSNVDGHIRKQQAEIRTYRKKHRGAAP